MNLISGPPPAGGRALARLVTKAPYNKIVAIIGSRDPNPYQRARAQLCSQVLSKRGNTIRTGAADGIDRAAMWGCHQGRLEVYLPWAEYNAKKIPDHAKKFVYDLHKHQDWTDSVGKYHPYVKALGVGGFALMARNFGIVKGSDLVLAFPKSPKALGGTGQGIRIAQDLGIEVVIDYGE